MFWRGTNKMKLKIINKNVASKVLREASLVFFSGKMRILLLIKEDIKNIFKIFLTM